jgi:hypothetical protein
MHEIDLAGLLLPRSSLFRMNLGFKTNGSSRKLLIITDKDEYRETVKNYRVKPYMATVFTKTAVTGIGTAPVTAIITILANVYYRPMLIRQGHHVMFICYDAALIINKFCMKFF